MNTLISKLNALNRVSRMLFSKTIAQIDSTQANKFITRVVSTGSAEHYIGMNAIPRMREWIGGRVVKEIKGFEMVIKNRKFEVTVGIDAEDLEDDRLGLFLPAVSQLATEASEHLTLMAVEALAAGDDDTYGLAYDGQNFFDKDHPVNQNAADPSLPKVYSNLLDGTGIQDAQIIADFERGIYSLRGVYDDMGRPFFSETDFRGRYQIICGPKLEFAMKRIFESERNAAGATNIYRGLADVYVTHYIKDTRWIIEAPNPFVAPIIAQIRRVPTLKQLTNPTTNEDAFKYDKFLFGTDYRGNVGYALWQTVVMIKNA